MAIYIHDEAARLRLRVTGDLDDRSARELALCWRTAGSVVAGRKVVVDLTALALAHAVRESELEVLAQLHDQGVEFLVRTETQKALVEEITGTAARVAQPAAGANRRRILW